jgi:hypothetical protein
MLTAAMAVLATSCGDVAVPTGSPSSPPCRLLADYLRENDAAIGKLQRYSVALSTGNKTLRHCSGGGGNSAAVLQVASAGRPPAAVAILTRVDGRRLPLDLPVAAHLLGGGARRSLDAALIAAAPLPASSGRVAGHGDADFRVTGHITSRIDRQSREELFSFRLDPAPGFGVDRDGLPAAAGRPHMAAARAGELAGHAAILQLIMRHGDDHGAIVLMASSSGTPRSRPIAGRIVRLATGERSLYPGYTLAFFISEKTRRPRTTSLIFSDPGLLASAPSIERDLEYAAVLLIDKDQASGIAMWNTLRPLIFAALKNP